MGTIHGNAVSISAEKCWDMIRWEELRRLQLWMIVEAEQEASAGERRQTWTDHQSHCRGAERRGTDGETEPPSVLTGQ